MNSVSKRIIAAVMVFALLFTASVQSFAAGGDLAWEALWEKEGDNGVIIFPGSNESERRFSWYSATESVPKVIISESPLLTDSRTFTGTALAAPDGDFANKVTVTGLLSGNTYYYRCIFKHILPSNTMAEKFCCILAAYKTPLLFFNKALTINIHYYAQKHFKANNYRIRP